MVRNKIKKYTGINNFELILISEFLANEIDDTQNGLLLYDNPLL